MNKIVILACAGLSLASAPSLLAFAQVAHGELLLATTARAMYDSRVFGGLSDEDDYIYTLHPELQFHREGALFELDARLGTRINRYHEYQQYDSEDLDTEVTFSMPNDTGRRISGSFMAGYNERTDVDFDVNRRIRVKALTTRFDGSVATGLKTSVQLGAGYRREYRNLFSDRRSREANAGFTYSDFFHGTSLNLRYRYLETDTNGQNLLGVGINQTSRTYSAALSRPLYANVRGTITYGYRILNRSIGETLIGQTENEGSIFSAGIEGPFLPESRFPKLESSASIVYSEAETPGINDVGGERLLGSLSLAWQARERTKLGIEARRSFELAVNDLTVETTSFSAKVNQDIGRFVSANLRGGYEYREYRGIPRNDDVYFVETGIDYRATQAWVVGADYRYRTSDSVTTIADYVRHVASVFARYTF